LGLCIVQDTSHKFFLLSLADIFFVRLLSQRFG
jgi:hypothetical protein